MKTSSCKAKGRRLCQWVKDKLLEFAPDLKHDDFIVTSSGDIGEDLKISPAGRAVYNYAIECKNVEKLNVWKAFEQAKAHVKEDRTPLLVHSKNRSDVLVTLRFEDFLKLTR